MKLQPNKKYTTIAIYAFLVIAAAIALFYLINEHATVGRVIGTFVSLMIPFIYGAALAYILNPVLNWLEKKVFPGAVYERLLSRRARRSNRGAGFPLSLRQRWLQSSWRF